MSDIFTPPARFGSIVPPRWASILRAPGASSWLLCALLILGAVLLIFAAKLATLAAPFLATAVLVLAMGRYLMPRRELSEAIALAAGLFVVVGFCAWMVPAPVGNALMPIAALCMIVTVIIVGAWHYAPDTGQRGWRDAIWPALPRAVGPAFGLSVAMIPAMAALISRPHATVSAILLSGGAVVGYCIQRLLSRRRRTA